MNRLYVFVYIVSGCTLLAEVPVVLKAARFACTKSLQKSKGITTGFRFTPSFRYLRKHGLYSLKRADDGRVFSLIRNRDLQSSASSGGSSGIWFVIISNSSDLHLGDK
jgi:hypothetical protein